MLKRALPQEAPGLVKDMTGRDCARKLRLFNAFAEPELRQAIASLGLERGMRILDAGCGGGEALGWLAEEVGPHGLVVGVDLAAARAAATRATARVGTAVLQAESFAAAARGQQLRSGVGGECDQSPARSTCGSRHATTERRRIVLARARCCRRSSSPGTRASSG